MKSLTNEMSPQARKALLIAAAATLPFVVLLVAPAGPVSGASFAVIACGALLLPLLVIVSAPQRSQGLRPAKCYLGPVLVVWWSLLVSDQLFFRHTPEAESFAGHFSAAAYAEAAFWALAFLALLLIMPRLQYLRIAFSGSNKWLSLFAVVCLVSAPFSPTPLYSLVWMFKLFLVVLLLLLCSAAIHDSDDVEAFFWANLWGFVIMAVVPVARAFADPSTAFESGRLNALTDPPGLSLSGGALVVFALTLNSLRKRTWLVGFGILGATVMIMAGGKASIIGGIASVTLFFALQRRVAAGFGWLLGVSVLGSIILAVTPLSSYFIAYRDAGDISTLTGRTELWSAAWRQIVQRPLVGHGYLASRFVSQVTHMPWTETGEMHNGFLEALYNNGLVGLCILIGIHLVIVKNLWRTVKSPANRKVRLLAIGSLAIYLDLLVSGLFDACFGGRAGPKFMLLLSLIVVSETLRRIAQPRLQWRLISPPPQKPPLQTAGIFQPSRYQARRVH